MSILAYCIFNWNMSSFTLRTEDSNQYKESSCPRLHAAVLWIWESFLSVHMNRRWKLKIIAFNSWIINNLVFCSNWKKSFSKADAFKQPSLQPYKVRYYVRWTELSAVDASTQWYTKCLGADLSLFWSIWSNLAIVSLHYEHFIAWNQL